MRGKRSLKILLFFIFLVVIFAIFGNQGLIKLYKVSIEKEKIALQNRVISEENQRLKEEIEMLKTDNRYLERIAREELGMIGRNETVYQFEE